MTGVANDFTRFENMYTRRFFNIAFMKSDKNVIIRFIKQNWKYLVLLIPGLMLQFVTISEPLWHRIPFDPDTTTLLFHVTGFYFTYVSLVEIILSRYWAQLAINGLLSNLFFAFDDSFADLYGKETSHAITTGIHLAGLVFILSCAASLYFVFRNRLKWSNKDAQWLLQLCFAPVVFGIVVFFYMFNNSQMPTLIPLLGFLTATLGYEIWKYVVSKSHEYKLDPTVVHTWGWKSRLGAIHKIEK